LTEPEGHNRTQGGKNQTKKDWVTRAVRETKYARRIKTQKDINVHGLFIVFLIGK